MGSDDPRAGRKRMADQMEFFEAVKEDNVAAVRSYIDDGNDVDARVPEGVSDFVCGVTALMIAALNNRSDLAKLLVDVGANVDVQASNGLTALSAASAEGYTDIMKLLIEANAELDAKDGVNLWTPLMDASGENQLAAVRLLIEAGADVDSTDKWGRTALIIAVERGFTPITRALIDANADVNVVILPYGISALERARVKGHSDIARMLEAAGAVA
jgi:ankyrin repeat protein